MKAAKRIEDMWCAWYNGIRILKGAELIPDWYPKPLRGQA